MSIRDDILDYRNIFQDELDDINNSIESYYERSPNITTVKITQQNVVSSYILMEKIDLLNDLLDKIDEPKDNNSRKQWYWKDGPGR